MPVPRRQLPLMVDGPHALPEGPGTWLLTNRKPTNRQGKVQLIDASGERFWKPMRKPLGSKRREIPEEARADIVRIYEGFLNGESGESEVSKIFDTTDFGYREIRVERPLKLNFQASEERIARLADEKAFARLPEDEREKLDAVLLGMSDRLFTNRDDFEKALNKELKAGHTKIGAPVKKANRALIPCSASAMRKASSRRLTPISGMAAIGPITPWPRIACRCRRSRPSAMPKATTQRLPMSAPTGRGTLRALSATLAASAGAMKAMPWKSLSPNSPPPSCPPILT